MKKILITLLAVFLALPLVWAVPADPTPYKYIQPDGSVITLINHGDEYFHWTTDVAGRIVEKGADGFYRPTGESTESLAVRGEQERQKNYAAMNIARWSSFDNPPETNFGDRKVLCIIANFTDSTFVVENPKEHFWNMLNQPGYSENGAVGSVKDYYLENSLTQYRPEFDVYGPVNLTNSSAYYDQNGVYKAILEAYDLLKDQINIADYDTDDNGAIDMVLFYYPGHNQAEGAGAESIWPHQGSGYYGQMGGKDFVRYFCTSELRGATGTEPAAIGTTCHEFAHSLGLPDFYDTDYDSNGRNSFTTGAFDLMTSGNYNDNGRRPPYLSALERNMLGWMDYPAPITEAGGYALSAVQHNQAYQFETSVPGEYFILESRDRTGWDSTLPAGLLLYHIDKSDRLVGGGQTAAQLWNNSNSINAFGGHPCYCLVPSVSSPSYYSHYVFPGYSDITSFSPKDWNGNPVAVSLSSISHDGSVSSFMVSLPSVLTVLGTVTDTDGNPLAGVEVSLTPSVAPFNAAPSLLSTSVSCITDESGTFSLELDDKNAVNQILAARKDGYIATCVNLTLDHIISTHNLVMLRQGEDTPLGLYKYDASLPELLCWQIGGNTGSRAVGVQYTASELEDAHAVGGLLTTVRFIAGAETYTDAYIVVDIEGGESLRLNITSQYTPHTLITIDVSSAGIVIPEGKTMYIGYGFTDLQSGEYPFYAYCYTDVDRHAFYTCPSFIGSTSWTQVRGDAELLISATVERTQDVTFSTLGVSYIKVENGLPTVAVAAGKSLRSMSWYLDGTAVNTPPAITGLSAGSHTYMVRLNYYDGTSERVYYDVTVQ